MESDNNQTNKPSEENRKSATSSEVILPEIFLEKQYSEDDQHILMPELTPFTRVNRMKSISEIPETVRSQNVEMDNFQRILENNQNWSQQMLKISPDFFNELKDVQKPEFLWIGCSDSRVPPNEILGLKPGELFVHRNIANQAILSDSNCLSVIQFSVEVLKVKEIIVCGHYGCGGIKASFKKHDHGILQTWLSNIRELIARYRKDLKHPSHTEEENENMLVELNVKQQVYNIARVPIVQKVWKEGQQLKIHGIVYQLHDGVLSDLGLTIESAEQLPEEYKIY